MGAAERDRAGALARESGSQDCRDLWRDDECHRLAESRDRCILQSGSSFFAKVASQGLL